MRRVHPELGFSMSWTCPKCGKVIEYRGLKPELLEHFEGEAGKPTHCFPEAVWRSLYQLGQRKGWA
jgi:hypothetical protein